MNSLPDLPLFYDPSLRDEQEKGFITDKEFHHAAHVLRIRPEQDVLVSNGTGLLVRARVVDADKRQMVYSLIEIIQNISDNSGLPILCVGLLRNKNRTEWLIEKAVEIGVDRICFLQTERSISAKSKMQKKDRWDQQAISAFKQSRKAFLPNIELMNLEESLQEFSDHPKFLAHCQSSDLPHILNVYKGQQNGAPCVLYIGPEGDFSDSEIATAISAGAESCSLGTERLRTETAALYGLVCLNAISD